MVAVNSRQSGAGENPTSIFTATFVRMVAVKLRTPCDPRTAQICGPSHHEAKSWRVREFSGSSYASIFHAVAKRRKQRSKVLPGVVDPGWIIKVVVDPQVMRFQIGQGVVKIVACSATLCKVLQGVMDPHLILLLGVMAPRVSQPQSFARRHRSKFCKAMWILK